MKLRSISITNYRGIKEEQSIPLGDFASIVGKNDSGKSIVLNAIASFLNVKQNPITTSDFNNPESPIEIACTFTGENLVDLLESKIRSKIKKADGLDEFISDLLPDRAITIKRTMGSAKKAFDSEQILMDDYESEDLAFLYGKRDDELTEIVDRLGISIPAQGVGRNSKLEKIKHIKKHCDSQGMGRSKRFIDDEYKIGSLLPDVELFEADYGLEADTKFKTTSVSEIADYLEREGEEKRKLAIVEQEIADEMQKEAQSVKRYMNDYVANLNTVEINPNIVWKDAIKSVDVAFQFDGDERPIPMSHKGAGYRRLFMVARFRYLAEKTKGLNVIYLIEEPETFLHPSAQNDLLDALRDLSDDNQVIITTHSPVFAGATNIESAILCRKEGGSVYEHCGTNGSTSLTERIVDELGIKPSYNLRDQHEKIVFVESHNDAQFYDLVAKEVLGSELITNPRVLVLPFGGGEDIDSFVNIDYFDQCGRDLYLIIDSDKHEGKSERQEERAARFRNNKKNGRAYVLQKSCLENYYHPRAFERAHDLPMDSFPWIADGDNARSVIKQYKADQDVGMNIKEKNNFTVLSAMTREEWQEVAEDQLIEFLDDVVS